MNGYNIKGNFYLDIMYMYAEIWLI